MKVVRKVQGWLAVIVVLSLSVPLFAQGKNPTASVPINDPAIVFEARGRGYDLVVMDADGTHRVTIIGGPKSDASQNRQATWSPDGSKIAFVSNRSGKGIYIARRDGTGICKVVDVLESGEFGFGAVEPVWSPMPIGGQDKIAYQAQGSNPQFTNDFDIYLVNAACPGGTPVNLTNTPGISEQGPSWSPSADRLAVSHTSGSAAGNIFVYTLARDATTGDYSLTNELMVTTVGPLAGGDSFAPDWANVTPDLLAVSNNVNGGSPDVFALPINDPNPARNVTNSPTFMDVAPAWSPDDRKMVVYGRLDPEPGGTAGIYIIEVDTGTRTRVVQPDRTYGWFESPDWRRCDRDPLTSPPPCAP
jgi:Tol biopolymer transport system component